MKKIILTLASVLLLISVNAFAAAGDCDLQGSSLSGGVFFQRVVTGSGTDDSPYLFANTGRKLYFGSNGYTTNPYMLIDLNGNVGIGTTAPAQKLSVAGTIESTVGGIKYPDGSVQTSAASGTGGGSLRMQVFGASGTFTAPAGVTSVVVELWGGGGGGASGGFIGGGGGGGGAYAKGAVIVTPGNVYTVTVGAAGAGGAGVYQTNGNPGGAGGASSFGTLISAGGGGGGMIGSYTFVGGTPALGGAGGTSTAAFAIPGINGASGQPIVLDQNFNMISGGAGTAGGSVGGYFGYGGTGGAHADVGGAGSAGILFGSGGGGGGGGVYGGAGGAGVKGKVVVWYIN